jgi:hypothetical protein
MVTPNDEGTAERIGGKPEKLRWGFNGVREKNSVNFVNSFVAIPFGIDMLLAFAMPCGHGSDHGEIRSLIREDFPR